MNSVAGTVVAVAAFAVLFIVARSVVRSLGKKAVGTLKQHLPVEVIYSLNGAELFRETTSLSRIEQRGIGVDGFLTKAVEQGLVRTGEAWEEKLSGGGYRLTMPVKQNGRTGTFTMEVRPAGS